MSGSQLPAGWATARLDQIAQVRLGRQRSPKNHTGSQMGRYLRAANITWNGVDVRDVKEMNFEEDEVVAYRLQDGDVLLSEASGSAGEVGKPGVWRGQLSGAVCFQNTLLRVRPEQGVDSDFLYYRFLHEALRGGFAESSRGVGIHHLGAAKLASMPIEVPPTPEQRRIVSELAAQWSLYKSLISSVEVLVGRVSVSADSRLGQLRNLLLRQAFSGTLVPQDASDESARALLARIAAQREAEEESGTRRKVRTRTRGARQDRQVKETVR